MKLLILTNGEARGSEWVEIYDKKGFKHLLKKAKKKYDLDEIKYPPELIELEKVTERWTNENDEIKKLIETPFFADELNINTCYVYCYCGFVEIKKSTKWILTFSPDTYEDAITIDENDGDIDVYVKHNCLKVGEYDECDIKNWHEHGFYPIINPFDCESLDWSGETSYYCFNSKYDAGLFGWIDGSCDGEPFLHDITKLLMNDEVEGYGRGIRRINAQQIIKKFKKHCACF